MSPAVSHMSHVRAAEKFTLESRVLAGHYEADGLGAMQTRDFVWLSVRGDGRAAPDCLPHGHWG